MVLVTGASGHLGANLVRALLAQGRDVRCLVHNDRRALEGLPVSMVPGDVLNPESLVAAMADVDVLYHCVALISIVGPMGGRVRRINVDGVRNVALAARAAGVRRMVHISSCHAFDLREPRVHEGGKRPGPDHPAYDRSKAAGEAALREVEDLDFTILNPGGCIGPWDYGPSRMGKAFLDIRNRRMPALSEGGFHFIDMRDVADAALAAEVRGKYGENYLMGGHYATIADLLRQAADVCGVAPPRLVVPMWLARLGAPLVQAYAQAWGIEPLVTPEALFALRSPPHNFDQQKAVDELGMRCRPLEASLRDIYDSFARLGP